MPSPRGCTGSGLVLYWIWGLSARQEPHAFGLISYRNALSAAPRPRRSAFCRGSRGNWQGEPGAGAAHLSLGFAGTGLEPHGSIDGLIHLSQPAYSQRSSVRAPSRTPLPVRAPACVSAETLARPFSAVVGLQHQGCLPENLEVSAVPETVAGSAGARTRFLKWRDSNADGDGKGREKRERKGKRGGRGREERKEGIKF